MRAVEIHYRNEIRYRVEIDRPGKAPLPAIPIGTFDLSMFEAMVVLSLPPDFDYRREDALRQTLPEAFPGRAILLLPAGVTFVRLVQEGVLTPVEVAP